MSGKDRRPSREEQALWQKMTGDVKPIARTVAPEPAEPAAAPRAKPPKAVTAQPRKSAAPAAPPPPRPVKARELTHGASPGVDRRTADKLKRGMMTIEARLDLHGMTQAEAHGRLAAFIEGHHAAGRRCVLVVTGKGTWREEGGVLRDAVPRWLNGAELRPRILSFCHAQPKDGGEGALYILLKRVR
jgi:DNA-nicking Smr family endonuclease